MNLPPHSRSLKQLFGTLIVAALFVNPSTPSQAATLYWDGTGTGWDAVTSWSTASGATTPDPGAVPGSGDIAQFNISTVNTAQTVNLNADQSAAGLIVSSTGTVLLQGGGTDRTLTLGTSGITLNSGAGAVDIGSATAGQKVAITVSGSQSWINNSGSLLNIVNDVATTGTSILTIGGTGNTTIAGIISGTGTSGVESRNIIKTGSGTLNLTGTANSFSGVISFEGGIVNVAMLSDYGVAGSLGNRGVGVDTNPVANTNPSNVGLHFNGGTLQYTGSTATSTDRGIRVGISGATLDASGTGSGTMSFTKSTVNDDSWDNPGARKLTLTGSNTGDNTFAINLQEHDSGHTSLLKSGAGTWVLTNSHNSDAQSSLYGTFGGYGGGTEINGGTLGFANNAIGGGVIDFTGNATLRWETGNTQDITSGTGAGVARSVKIEDGITATFNTNGHDVTLGTAFTVGGSANASVTKDGLGTLSLNAANTYTGVTTINAGIVQVGNVTALGPAANASVAFGPSATVGTKLQLNNNSITIVGLNSNATPGSPIVENGTAGAVTLTVNNAGANTFAGVIQDGAAGTLGLTKGAAGTLTLTGANTYTGATIVNGGTLEVGTGGALSATPSVTVNSGGTLLLSGTNNDKINNSAAVTLNDGTITLGGGLDETVGTLTLTGNSVIDFGALGNTLRFANSSGIWAGTLAIYNWTALTDRLYFGINNTGLSAAQLNQISFFSGAGTGFVGTGAFNLAPFDGANGEVSAVPEPSAVLVGLSLLSLAGYRERRWLFRCRAAKGTPRA